MSELESNIVAVERVKEYSRTEMEVSPQGRGSVEQRRKDAWQPPVNIKARCLGGSSSLHSSIQSS